MADATRDLMARWYSGGDITIDEEAAIIAAKEEYARLLATLTSDNPITADILRRHLNTTRESVADNKRFLRERRRGKAPKTGLKFGFS